MILEDLLIDSRDLDRALTRTLLWPFLRIDRATATIVPLRAWTTVPNEVRVLLFLVARRAMAALGLISAAPATPQEIERGTGIPGGSVRPALRRLLWRHLIVIGDGGYAVPNHALIRIVDLIQPSTERLIQPQPAGGLPDAPGSASTAPGCCG